MLGTSKSSLEKLFDRLSTETIGQSNGGMPMTVSYRRAWREWWNPISQARVDPHVSLQPDGYYYLVSSGANFDHVEGRRARTIAGLSMTQPAVLWRDPSIAESGRAIWAPELHRIDGKWFVYLALGRGGDSPASYLGVLRNTAEDPFLGAWELLGRLATHADTLALDPTTFHLRGSRYLVWTQIEPGRVGSNVYIARMDSPASISGTPTMICQPEHPWERRGYGVNEAPSVLIRNGSVFIAYTAGASVSERCLGMVVADSHADLLDPGSWSKSADPVFGGSVANGQLGPSHCSFTTTPDDAIDILVYQSCPVLNPGGTALGRVSLRAQAIAWRNKCMPEFGVPAPDGAYSCGDDVRPG